MAGKLDNSLLLVFVLIAQVCVVAAVNECEKGDSADPFPNPEGKCHLYLVCVLYDGNWEQRERPCESGKHFSNETLTCVHPDEALCLPELRNLTCQRSGDLLSHPTNCSRYFYCNAALRPTVTICPDNLHFSSALKQCVPKRDARCDPMYCDEFDDPMRPTLLPDPTNCATFFKCHNGEAIRLFCPQNLYFSIERDRCEFPFSVNCTDGVRPKD